MHRVQRAGAQGLHGVPGASVQGVLSSTAGLGHGARVGTRGGGGDAHRDPVHRALPLRRDPRALLPATACGGEAAAAGEREADGRAVCEV